MLEIKKILGNSLKVFFPPFFRDNHNTNAGCTVILSLLKPNQEMHPQQQGKVPKPKEEQLHVLPHYQVGFDHENHS